MVSVFDVALSAAVVLVVFTASIPAVHQSMLTLVGVKESVEANPYRKIRVGVRIGAVSFGLSNLLLAALGIADHEFNALVISAIVGFIGAVLFSSNVNSR